MPFLLLASSRLGLCLFPEWMDCVLVSAGSSGSPRPSACEHACDLYSGLLPVSDQNTHTHIWANEQNKCRRKMLYPVGQQNFTLWKKREIIKMQSLHLFHLFGFTRFYVVGQKQYDWAFDQEEDSASSLWSSASRLCTNEHDLDPWRHMTILWAHWLILPNDSFWQEMACVHILRQKMTFVLPSVTQSIFVAVWWQILADSDVSLVSWSLNEVWPPEAKRSSSTNSIMHQKCNTLRC